MGALGNIKHTLASNVADGATFTTAYPSGTNQDALTGSTGGVIVDQTTQAVWKQGAGGFTVSFGASTITITNDSDVTWAAGDDLVLSFGDVAINGSYNLTWPKQVQDAALA